MTEQKYHITKKQIRIRHSLLVDKKFLEGLTEKETIDLDQINHLLDTAEEKYYAPIKEALATVKVSFLEERHQMYKVPISANNIWVSMAQCYLRYIPACE